MDLKKELSVMVRKAVDEIDDYEKKYDENDLMYEEKRNKYMKNYAVLSETLKFVNKFYEEKTKINTGNINVFISILHDDLKMSSDDREKQKEYIRNEVEYNIDKNSFSRDLIVSLLELDRINEHINVLQYAIKMLESCKRASVKEEKEIKF